MKNNIREIDTFLESFEPTEKEKKIFDVAVRLRMMLQEFVADQRPLRVGESTILYPREQRIVYRNEEIFLTTMESAILHVLMSRPSQTYSRQQILEIIGDSGERTERTIDVQIVSIRRKLKNPNIIKCVRGIGYNFNIDEVEICAR